MVYRRSVAEVSGIESTYKLLLFHPRSSLHVPSSYHRSLDILRYYCVPHPLTYQLLPLHSKLFCPLLKALFASSYVQAEIVSRMRTSTLVVFAAALVLSQSIAAHGDEHMQMGEVNGAGNLSASPQIPTEAHRVYRSYFSDGSHTKTMVAHAAIMVLAWAFVLPVGVMFSLARSRLALPVQLLFTILNVLGLFFGIVFNARTDDLYPNNAHHKMGWVATWMMVAQVFMSVLFAYGGRSNKPSASSSERVAFLPSGRGQMEQVHDGLQNERNYRWSGDSGQGTEPPSPSSEEPQTDPQRQELYNLLSKPEPGNVLDADAADDDDTDDDHAYQGRRRYLHIGVFDKYLANVSGLLSKRITAAMSVAYEFIDRTILILTFMVLCSGGITYAGIMKGGSVFNGLAHFIKGGIFFWYGLLTLGRWMGSFADLGWAWNIRPSRSETGRWRSRVPSGEFVESFVIWLYGATNMWLEHLAAWGDAWEAQDLEHVSISIMFFGGGLCGMLVESTTIREWLNASVASLPENPNATEEELNIRLPPRIYKTSMNPLPALIILLLGIMMSGHSQDSMVSSMVHKQWGTLLVGFSFARAVTYIILYIAPPTSYYPSRPPSELVSAFCLISGGLLFIASNKDTIEAMEAYNLHAMFMFTVMMGLTAFIMGWEVLVLSLKGWALKRSAPPKFGAAKYQA